MTPQEILEGNKLIAEFMGFTVYDKRYPRNHSIGVADATIPQRKDYILEKCKYHTSWEWLMMAVDKMEDDGYCFTSDPWTHKLIEYGTVDERVVLEYEKQNENTNLENLYYPVIEFIKWYKTYKSK